MKRNSIYVRVQIHTQKCRTHFYAAHRQNKSAAERLGFLFRYGREDTGNRSKKS